MFKVTIAWPATVHRIPAGKEMGINISAVFEGTDSEAIVDGYFAMRANEVQAVLKSMREGGINTVAIHQHMAHDQPHYLFMHYWGKGGCQGAGKSHKEVTRYAG
jgi:hypothetical protein